MIKKIFSSKNLWLILIFITLFSVILIYFLFFSKEKYKVINHIIETNINSTEYKILGFETFPIKFEKYIINNSKKYDFTIYHFSTSEDAKKFLEKFIEIISKNIEKVENYNIMNYNSLFIHMKNNDKFLVIEKENMLISTKIENVEKDKKVLEWFLKIYI